MKRKKVEIFWVVLNVKFQQPIRMKKEYPPPTREMLNYLNLSEKSTLRNNLSEINSV